MHIADIHNSVVSMIFYADKSRMGFSGQTVHMDDTRINNYS